MKLWHDDVRPPPPGWAWARTNDQAKAVLLTGNVTDLSLDHDMGYDGPPPGECEACEGVGLVAVNGPAGVPHTDRCSACDGDGFIGGDVLYVTGTDEDDGTKLAEWLAERPQLIPPRVTIHSWNDYGARRMADILRAAGAAVAVRPFRSS